MELLALGGCATALDKKAGSVDISKESIVVYPLDLVNEFKPGFPATYLAGAIGKLEDRYDSTVKQHKDDYRSLRNQAIVRAPLARITLARSIGSQAAPIEVMLSKP